METEEHPITQEVAPEITNITGHDTCPPAAELTYTVEEKAMATSQPLSTRTPMPMSPVGCSTERTTRNSTRERQRHQTIERPHCGER